MKENVSDYFQMTQPKITEKGAKVHTQMKRENKTKHGERLMTEFG